MKKIVLLAILAALAVWYFDLSRRMTEESIRESYREQLDAMNASNAEFICSRMADDYRQVDVTYSRGGQEERTLDRTMACNDMDESLRLMKRLGEASGGVLSPTFSIDIKRIELSPDRKTAIVEGVGTVKVGEILLARNRGTDRLIRRAGRILSQGGESKTWVYAQ